MESDPVDFVDGFAVAAHAFERNFACPSEVGMEFESEVDLLIRRSCGE